MPPRRSRGLFYEQERNRIIMFEGSAGYYGVCGGLFETLEQAEDWCIKNKVPTSLIEFCEVV